LDAGITTWSDAAGKYLSEMFTAKELQTSCPTVAGSLMFPGKIALDASRISTLRGKD
jgi:hypothetical protein